MNYSDILSNIKTVGEANLFASEIDTLLDALFKTQGNAFEKALNSIGVTHKEMLKQTFLKNNINSENQANIKECLTSLSVEVRKLKTFKISLAFEASQNTIDNLFNWVLKNLESGIILEIKTDKSIIGGVIIEFEGRYKDLTLRKKLEEVFENENKREEIMSNETST